MTRWRVATTWLEMQRRAEVVRHALLAFTCTSSRMIARWPRARRKIARHVRRAIRIAATVLLLLLLKLLIVAQVR